MGQLSIFQATLLGIVQGATEFLPVSSSGHLVLAQHFLGVRLENGQLLALDISLHFGTLLAVIVFFWRDLYAMLFSVLGREIPGDNSATASDYRKLFWFLILGTIPAVIIGLGFKDFFEGLFANPRAAACMLLVTGAVLFTTRLVKEHFIALPKAKSWHAVAIGLAQAVAIIPGISRSGSTISAALLLKLDRTFAARFSFLLSVPAVAGATVLGVEDLQHFSSDTLVATLVGTFVSFIVGVACIKWLLAIVRKGQFWWFAIYCWVVGLLAIAFV